MRVSFLAVALGLAAPGCSPPCAMHADCGEGQFCETPTGECGSETGHCAEIHSDIGCYPTTTEELAVCGCDVPEVLARLSDEQQGELVAAWFQVMHTASQILEAAAGVNELDLERLIVRRGNDSSTWNEGPAPSTQPRH